jgi:hypothetical protein
MIDGNTSRNGRASPNREARLIFCATTARGR